MKPWLLFLVIFTLHFTGKGQENLSADTVAMEEIVVKSYLSEQAYLSTPASVAVLDAKQLRIHTDLSLLPALNLVPGVRMEERSPGSYRLSIRGSLLRSPFGVRNVKIYLDEFPLTDAGGNTYLNLIDPSAACRIEVLRGPDGSLFGANSGGVFLLGLNSGTSDTTSLEAGLRSGSYGLLHQHVSATYTAGPIRFSGNQAYQRSDGYRSNSSMHRLFVQGVSSYQYGKNNSIKLLLMYADLGYRTPGGLTLAQYEEDPRQARPASRLNPGAVEQKAGIYNKTLFSGLSNTLFITDRVRMVTSAFGSATKFENPFITNYEIRDEKNLGLRTFADVYSRPDANFPWKLSLGMEGQQGSQDIANYSNNGGLADSLTASDNLRIRQAFYFSRYTATIAERLTTEMAVSYNTNTYFYDKGATTTGMRTFGGQWMPRLALSYKVNKALTVRTTISKGYSPPTIAEVRSSNNQINTGLTPESGWNREAGFRITLWKNRLMADVAAYRYDLKHAIVRRTDDTGAEYFSNAGGTRQLGLEIYSRLWLVVPRMHGVFRSLQMAGSYTYSHFNFRDYSVGSSDYSGNKLTGVPPIVAVVSLEAGLSAGLSIFAEINSTSSLPLNDGNTAEASGYQLLISKIQWSRQWSETTLLNLYVGGNNLLNQKFSLGNDINAFGGRYYNAAPPVNFFAGFNITFK